MQYLKHKITAFFLDSLAALVYAAWTLNDANEEFNGYFNRCVEGELDPRLAIHLELVFAKIYGEGKMTYMDVITAATYFCEYYVDINREA